MVQYYLLTSETIMVYKRMGPAFVAPNSFTGEFMESGICPQARKKMTGEESTNFAGPLARQS